DTALVTHLRALGAAGDQTWTRDTLRVAAAASMWEELTLIPVRGESTIKAELALVSRGVLTAQQAARVRALDWTRPVQSELRCGLFRQGRDRIDLGALDAALESLPEGASNADLVPLVYDEVMRLDAGGELVDLVPPAGADLLAVADALDPEDYDALQRGDLARFARTANELAGDIDAHVEAIDRAALRGMRQTRACRAIAELPITPLYLDLDCSSARGTGRARVQEHAGQQGAAVHPEEGAAQGGANVDQDARPRGRAVQRGRARPSHRVRLPQALVREEARPLGPQGRQGPVRSPLHQVHRPEAPRRGRDLRRRRLLRQHPR